MSALRPTSFSLRLRDSRLRDLVRRVAEQDSVSQNELIEQAIEHEMILRGELIAEDLQSAARALADLTRAQHADLVARSIERFARDEAHRDPTQGRHLTSRTNGTEPALTDVPLGADVSDRFGAVAAFEAAGNA